MFKRNKKIIWIVAIGLIGLLLANVLFNWKTVYEVFAGEQSLGIARNVPFVLAEYEKLQELEQKEHPELTHVMSPELTIVKKKEWFPDDNTERILKALPVLLNPLVKATEIQVDGAKVAMVMNEEQAIRAISLIKAPFESENGTYSEIMEQVTFQSAEVQPDFIVTAERAAELMLKVKEEPVTYLVEDGDTLWDIAQKTNTPFAQLVLMNTDSGELLKAGQKVILSPEKRLVNVKTQTQKIEQMSIPFRTIIQSGTVQEQDGKEGLKEIAYQVTAINGMQVASDNLGEKVLQKPIDQIKQKKARVQISSASSAANGGAGFIWPTDGGIITTGFEFRDEEFHEGYDIAGANTLQIKASASGKVIFSGWKNGYGNIIILSHSNGLTTYYAHNKENNVSVGDQVNQGQVIAIMGSTGKSTGVHLHFEIRSKGQAVDPGSYLKS